MTESEIQELESETGLVLPARYQSFLLDYPQPLIDMGDEHGQGPENYELYRHRKNLFAANCCDSSYDGQYPESFFIIGDNGCGDVFAIDTSQKEAPVYVLSPHIGELDGAEEGQPSRLCDSIEQ